MKIGFRDWTSTATFSGGSWRSEYPVDNVGIPEMARVARSTDASPESTQMTLTLNPERPAQLYSIVLPNATISAEFRIVRRDAVGDEIGDTGWMPVYPKVYHPGQLWWEDERFWGQSYTQDEIERAVFTRPYDTGDYQITREADILLSDPGNPDGYLDVCYVSVAESWQLSVNMAYGSAHTLETRSKAIQARGGAKAFSRLPKPRRLSATVDYMPHREAMEKAYELQRQLDITDAFLLHPYPDEPIQWLRTTFIARNRQLGAIERAVYDHDTVQFEFEEVL